MPFILFAVIILIVVRFCFTGWTRPTSSEFDKDMLEIDNIIQALDKPQQFDTSIQCKFSGIGQNLNACFNFPWYRTLNHW